jgi:amino acid adenylation domain-containing protein
MRKQTLNNTHTKIAKVPDGTRAHRGERSSPKLDEVQRHRLLVEWNNTASDFPKRACVHELFEEQALRSPKAVAVINGVECLTYEELNRRANQVGHYLRTLGVGPEVVVGICAERSLEMIIGLLGILKAGGAYLPLDVRYPQGRLAYMLKDAGSSFVVTWEGTTQAFVPLGVHLIRLDADWETIGKQPEDAPVSGATPENLVYTMYTSGSSGRPKAVGIVHYNVVRLVRNTNYIQIAQSDVFLQLAPVTFDAATFEIWGPLLNGATLVLYPPGQIFDLSQLKTLIRDTRVSILWLTAGLFHRIVDEDISLLAPIRQLLTGGDVVSAPHVKRVLEGISGCRIINGYGPTECATFSVCESISDSKSVDATVPIGRPISNTVVHVLDSELELVPVGVTGELYIGGAGLGRGYFNHPDLTAESFVPDPFGGDGSRLYRTGDLVRYRQDGRLEFVGRRDLQVKVSGYRVELEEIEKALLCDADVSQAIVVAQVDSNGDKRLVAYVVGKRKGVPDAKRLRNLLKQRLPDYMIPSNFVALSALPLTPNGKVDRDALPMPKCSTRCAEPLSSIENTIAEIVAGVLGRDEVGLDDDFFDLGGTSLGLISAVMKMSDCFGLPLDPGIVTRGATVKALAQAVNEKLDDAGLEYPSTKLRSEREAPRGSLESKITQILAGVLGADKVGLDDDFFDLGGTSLGLISAVMKMSDCFGLPLDPDIVTRGATVKALAQAVKERLADGTYACL